MVEQMWGLFLYSIVTGMGFEISHSISDLNRSYLTRNACIEAARSLNQKPNRDKQIGLDNGVTIRYVCILKPENDLSTCLLYTSPSPRDVRSSRMPSSA